MAKKSPPESGNPVVVALKYVFGPLAKKSEALPPPLAYGLPILVTILLIAVLKAALPTNIAWLLALAIVAPLAGYIATLGLVRHEPPIPPGPGPAKPGKPPWADIESPKSGDLVNTAIDCSGSATGIPPSMHLWLVVEEEKRKFIWPKAGEVMVNEQGKWKHRIFEQGHAQRVSVSLFMADPAAHEIIRSWLENGQLNGHYSFLKGIQGTTRMAIVTELQIKPSP